MYNRINRSTFIFVIVLILLIPLLIKSKLLLFGERIYGEVIEHKVVLPKAGSRHRSTSYYSIVQFKTQDTIIEMWSAENIVYAIDSKIKVIYDKKDPLNCMILSFSYIYSGTIAIVTGFLLLIWIAAYK